MREIPAAGHSQTKDSGPIGGSGHIQKPWCHRREASWIQPTPIGDLTVVYIEADDLDEMFDGLGSSQDPFDVWFREQTREVHGINIEDGVPSPEQILTFEAHATAA